MARPRDDRDEVIDYYLSVKRSRGRLSGAENADEPLDPIDPALIGALSVRSLYRPKSELRSLPWLSSLGLLLGEFTPEEVRPRPARTTAVTVVAGWFAPHVEQLVKWGLLKPAKLNPKADCGLFGVLKPGKGLRVIFNAKPANEVLEPIPRAQLQIFRLEDLITQYVGLSRRSAGGLYFMSVDYRHYYYQIPLPSTRWPYFVVNHEGRYLCLTRCRWVTEMLVYWRRL